MKMTTTLGQKTLARMKQMLEIWMMLIIRTMTMIMTTITITITTMITTTIMTMTTTTIIITIIPLHRISRLRLGRTPRLSSNLPSPPSPRPPPRQKARTTLWRLATVWPRSKVSDAFSVLVCRLTLSLPGSSSLNHFFPGGILTVADDLLKNDGSKFLEMMEQLAVARSIREEQNIKDLQDETDEDYDEK